MPYSMNEKVESEIQRLVAEGTLDWCNFPIGPRVAGTPTLNVRLKKSGVSQKSWRRSHWDLSG